MEQFPASQNRPEKPDEQKKNMGAKRTLLAATALTAGLAGAPDAGHTKIMDEATVLKDGRSRLLSDQIADRAPSKAQSVDSNVRGAYGSFKAGADPVVNISEPSEEHIPDLRDEESIDIAAVEAGAFASILEDPEVLVEYLSLSPDLTPQEIQELPHMDHEALKKLAIEKEGQSGSAALGRFV